MLTIARALMTRPDYGFAPLRTISRLAAAARRADECYAFASGWPGQVHGCPVGTIEAISKTEISSLELTVVLPGLVPGIHAAPLRTVFEISDSGTACGRMPRIRLGMAGTSPAKTRRSCRDQSNCKSVCPNRTAPHRLGGRAESLRGRGGSGIFVGRHRHARQGAQAVGATKS
jgi:hypothetical protein